jgi:formyl-CoA transferase
MANVAAENITVLDLTSGLGGAFCGLVLGDLGARVIKVESPGAGHFSRGMAPMQNEVSAMHLYFNRNARSVTADLKKQEGRELVRRLASAADVLVEDFPFGDMPPEGLSYDELHREFPRLIYASVTGYGRSGPYAKRPYSELTVQAMSGLMSISGWPQSKMVRTGNNMGAVAGGICAAIGILAAVQYRRISGRGQWVDIAETDALVSTMEIINRNYLVTGVAPARTGNRYDSNSPCDSFLAKDGLVVLTCANEKLWKAIVNLMGRNDLLEDGRFATMRDRVAHNDDIKKIVDAWISGYTVAEAVEQLLAAGIPAAPIYNIAQVVADDHIANAREMFTETRHPRAGAVRMTGSHIKMSEPAKGGVGLAPELGEHNREIYGELLGITPAELQELYEQKVI